MTFESWYKDTYPDLESDLDDFYTQLEQCFYAGRFSALLQVGGSFYDQCFPLYDKDTDQ